MQTIDFHPPNRPNDEDLVAVWEDKMIGNTISYNEIVLLLNQANLAEKLAIANLAIASLQQFFIPEFTNTTIAPNCTERVEFASKHIRRIFNGEKLAIATKILNRVSEENDDEDDGEDGDEDEDDDEDQKKLYYLTALREEMPLTIGETEEIREFLGC